MLNSINIFLKLEQTYKVKVEKLNSLNVKSKPKVFKGQRGKRSEVKRIIVTLKEGNTIDMGAKVK
jgi:large subunit ribosomal protein L23